MRTIEQTNDYLGSSLKTLNVRGLINVINHQETVDVPSVTLAYDRLPLDKRMDLFSENPLDWYTPLRSRSETYSRCQMLELDLASYSPVGSFKFRGAWNAIASQPYEQLLQHGVVTASQGNHALGVAISIRRINELYHSRGYDNVGRKRAIARIYVPKGTAPIKIEHIKAFGGDDVELVIAGDSYADAEQQAYEYNKRFQNSVYIHAFDNQKVIYGQSTAGLELVRQLGRLDLEPSAIALVVPVGGGGLLAGIVKAVSHFYPDPNNRPKTIGAQAEGADSAAQTWRQFKATGILEPVTLSGSANRLADGTAVRRMGDIPSRYLPLVDDFVVITNQELSKGYADTLDAIAMNYTEAYANNGIDPFYGMHEPASMIAEVAANKFAAEHSGLTVISLITGINYNPALVQEILALSGNVTLSTTRKKAD